MPCNTLQTLRSRVVLERLILSQPLKKFPTYLKPEGLFLFLQEPTLSWINIWYLPYSFLKIHFNIIYHLCLGLPTGFLPLCFPVKTLYKFIFFPILATPHPFHPSCLYYPDSIWQEVQVLKHVIMQFTHTPVDPSHIHIFSQGQSLGNSESVYR